MTTTMNLNLLPSRAKFQVAKIKLKHKVLMAMVGVAVVWTIITTIVLGLNLYTKIMVNNVSDRYNKVLGNYKSMADDIVVNQSLKYNAKMVGGVLHDRFEYGKSFELIQNLFPEGIVLKDYNLKSNGAFAISGTTQTKENIDLLENRIIEINGGSSDRLLSANLKSLALRGTDWSFTMEVTLK